MKDESNLGEKIKETVVDFLEEIDEIIQDEQQQNCEKKDNIFIKEFIENAGKNIEKHFENDSKKYYVEFMLKDDDLGLEFSTHMHIGRGVFEDGKSMLAVANMAKKQLDRDYDLCLLKVKAKQLKNEPKKWYKTTEQAPPMFVDVLVRFNISGSQFPLITRICQICWEHDHFVWKNLNGDFSFNEDQVWTFLPEYKP